MIFDFRDVLSPLPNSAQWTDKLFLLLNLVRKNFFKFISFVWVFLLSNRNLKPFSLDKAVVSDDDDDDWRGCDIFLNRIIQTPDLTPSPKNQNESPELQLWKVILSGLKTHTFVLNFCTSNADLLPNIIKFYHVCTHLFPRLSL